MGRMPCAKKTGDTIENKSDGGGPKGKRFGFTISKDIVLLKSTLQHNPFQLGAKKWADVASEMKDAFNETVLERTVKERVIHLKKLYETQQLSYRTGTEEEKSERGKLLESIIELYEESVATINLELGANEEIEIDGTYVTPSAAEKRADKILADSEREKIANDLAPEPGPKRKKQRLMPEDELIKMKLQHDMKLEAERFRLEEEKLRQTHELECRKLELETKKFEFEREKEQRLSEENRQKDEIARMQMGFQENLIKVLSKFAEK